MSRGQSLAAGGQLPNPVDYVAMLQAEMVRVLPPQSQREKDAFAKLDAREQALRFLNWQSRLVHPHSRQVNKSVGFDNLPGVQTNKHAVENLLAKIDVGDDVSMHLSENVMQGYCLHPPGNKDGRDFDLLLNEWGIHHLHLGQVSGPSGFSERSEDLLFVI